MFNQNQYFQKYSRGMFGDGSVSNQCIFIYSFLRFCFYYILASRVEVLNNLPVGGLFIAYLSACLVSGMVLKTFQINCIEKLLANKLNYEINENSNSIHIS